MDIFTELPSWSIWVTATSFLAIVVGIKTYISKMVYIEKDRNESYQATLQYYQKTAEKLKQKCKLVSGVVSRCGTSNRGSTESCLVIAIEGNQDLYFARNWSVEVALTKPGDEVTLYIESSGKVLVLENQTFRTERHRTPAECGVVGWA